MSARNRTRITGRRTTKPFLMLPKDMLDSPEFAALSAPAVKITLDIARLHNGKNNGTLEAPYKTLQRVRHWNSRSSIASALGDALRSGFLIRTRRGRRFGGKPEPSLYAISWEPIPASDLHSISSRAAPNTWKVQNAGPKNGLVKPKQVQPLDLVRQKRDFGQRRNAGFASPYTPTASPKSGPSFYIYSSAQKPAVQPDSTSRAWPAPGTAEYDALVAKYCYFDIPLREQVAV